MERNVPQGILESTSRAGKSYAFSSQRNPSLPADYWFQNSSEGLTLFVVFYAQACRWSNCTGCNLPSMMSQYFVPSADIIIQAHHLFFQELDSAQRKKIRKVILSNNGSLLDEVTFPQDSLAYLCREIRNWCPNLVTLTLETRAEFVSDAALGQLRDYIGSEDDGLDLELAIGFEAFDNEVRNKFIGKGLSLQAFERLAQQSARNGIKLKTYFMMKPVPQMNDSQAVEDIVGAVNYLDDLSERYDLKINMHLNPTYVAKGTLLEISYKSGRYTPPRLEHVAVAVLAAEDTALEVFVGLYDEGLAVEGGSFIRSGDAPLVEALEDFNSSQDYQTLRSALARESRAAQHGSAA